MTDSRPALKRFVYTLALGMLLTGAHTAATAGVLVNQPYLAGGDSFLSTVSGGYENAESFSLPTTETITSIIWWGSDAGLNDFLIRMGSSLGNWSNLFGTVTRTATSGIDSENRPIYQFQQILGNPWQPSAGTYFLSISQEAEEWFWTIGSLDATSGQQGNFFREPGQDWITENVTDLSFRLVAADQEAPSIPEPGTLVLILAGILAGRKFQNHLDRQRAG